MSTGVFSRVGARRNEYKHLTKAKKKPMSSLFFFNDVDDHRRGGKKTLMPSPFSLFPLSPTLVPLSIFRHVVLPQDITQLLPKGKLLSEVRNLMSLEAAKIGAVFSSSSSFVGRFVLLRPQPHRGGGGELIINPSAPLVLLA